MIDKYKQSDDILFYLRDKHTGADKSVRSEVIECIFGINGAALRQIVNKLRCDGHPICSDANGYYYAINSREINDTIRQLLGRTEKIVQAVSGLTLSHQIFYNGTDECI
jgi:transcription initiation factor IIE alpha subunit